MKIVPYDRSINSEYVEDVVLDIKPEWSKNFRENFDLHGIWSLVDNSVGVAIFACFLTKVKGEIYFSLVASDYVRKNHGIFLARLMVKGIKVCKERSQYTLGWFDVEEDDPRARRFAEWLGFKDVSIKDGKIRYELEL